MTKYCTNEGISLSLQEMVVFPHNSLVVKKFDNTRFAFGGGYLLDCNSTIYGINPGNRKDASAPESSFFVMPCAADPCLKHKSNIKSYEKFRKI